MLGIMNIGTNPSRKERKKNKMVGWSNGSNEIMGCG
jgi:hypothetical protein